MCDSVFHNMDVLIYLSTHSLTYVWVVSSFWLLQVMLWWTFVYNSSCGHIFISLVKHPRMALLELAISLILLKTAKLSFKVVIPLYTPINSVWKLWLLYIPYNIRFFFFLLSFLPFIFWTILMGLKWYHI